MFQEREIICTYIEPQQEMLVPKRPFPPIPHFRKCRTGLKNSPIWATEQRPRADQTLQSASPDRRGCSDGSCHVCHFY